MARSRLLGTLALIASLALACGSADLEEGDASAAAAAEAPAAGAQQASTRVLSFSELCQRQASCGCAEAGADVQGCVDGWNIAQQYLGQLQSQVCLSALSCEEICQANTTRAQDCAQVYAQEVAAASAAVQRDAAAQSAQQQQLHDQQMQIIGNMGATCPSGSRMLNGECVYY